MIKAFSIAVPLGCALLMGGGQVSVNASEQRRSGSPIKCKLEKVTDAQSGLVAFTYFVPQGWVAHNRITWTSPGAFVANLSASTSDRHYSVSQLQRLIYKYSSMPNLGGQGVPVHHATDYLHTLVDQLKTQFGLADVKVLDEINGPLPEEKVSQLSKSAPADPIGARYPLNEVGFLQVGFELDGVPVTAALGTSITGAISTKHVLNHPEQVTSESGVFAVGPTTVVISPTSPAASKLKEVQLIASSMMETPQFLAFWRKLNARLAGDVVGSNIKGQIEADKTWHERSMAQFRNSMEMKDAYSRQFCNYIGDQQDYRDTNGSVISLPATYKHAWADGQGNYLLTDDAAVDLRGYGNGKWEQMEKARPGE